MRSLLRNPDLTSAEAAVPGRIMAKSLIIPFVMNKKPQPFTLLIESGVKRVR
jgi:hypothetical protein